MLFWPGVSENEAPGPSRERVAAPKNAHPMAGVVRLRLAVLLAQLASRGGLGQQHSAAPQRH